MRNLVSLGLVLISITGCKPQKSPPPTKPELEGAKPSSDVQALSTLGKSVFDAFITGEISHLKPYTLWGVPPKKLYAGMRHVYVVDARVTLARIQAVPLTNRTVAHTNELQKLKSFLANPNKEFERMKDALNNQMASLRRQHEAVFRRYSGNEGPDWGKPAPSIVVRPSIHLATPLPEAAVDVLFAYDGQSYQLQLNNCVKLPKHGWVLGADLEFVDLQAQANAEKEWSEDFPAAQVRAGDENKQLLVNFTGSDWSAASISFHKKILNSNTFMNYATNRYVLLRVDFPRNRPQSVNQRLANQILARKYNVKDFPAILILESNGTEIQRVSDYNGTDPAQFIRILSNYKK